MQPKGRMNLASWLLIVATLLSIAAESASSVCTSTCDPDGTCIFGGLKNTPEGNAVLSIDNQCRLVVGNIGGSGLDGVIQTYDPAPFMITRLAVPNFSGSIQGTSAVIKQIGIAGGQPDQEISFLRFVNFNDTDVRIDVNCLEIGASSYSLEVYQGHQLVSFQNLGIDPPVLFLPKEDLVQIACGIRPDGDVYTSFQLLEAQPFTIQTTVANPGPFVGDFVIVNGHSPAVVPTAQTAIDNIFTATGNVTMTSMAAGPLPYTFDDIRSNHPFFNSVEILRTNGVTAGCATKPPLYCPEQSVDRGQAAVLILAAVGATPDSSGNPIFEDVPASHPFYGFIQVFFQRGITAGCSTSPPLFCPSAPLTRSQAAVLILRALNIAPDPTGAQVFEDVPPDSPYYGYVQAFYRTGFTAGCSANPLKFCPDAPVNRAQIAAFLATVLAGGGAQ